MPAGAKVTFADTYLYLKPAKETDTATVCRSFVEMLADVWDFAMMEEGLGGEWGLF